MKLVGLVVGDTIESVGVDGLGQFLHLVDQWASLFGDEQPAGSLIAFLDVALYPALLLEPIYQFAECRLFDFEYLRESSLAYAFTAIDVDQYSPLRACESERFNATVINTPQQP